jgi:putative transposase
MARFARVVVVDVAHHVTQRGNARQVILSSDGDRVAYLELLRHYSELHSLAVLGYCLMSNHVHLIVVPRAPEALAQALQHTHGRYASYWNARNSSSGHVWQGRFYSCPLDETHLWRALRYVELNPVRAGMVPEAVAWRWSSAAAHCGCSAPMSVLPQRGHIVGRFPGGEMLPGSAGRRQNGWKWTVGTGRPLGSETFVAGLEHSTLRSLIPRKAGRPTKRAQDPQQDCFPFAA